MDVCGHKLATFMTNNAYYNLVGDRVKFVNTVAADKTSDALPPYFGRAGVDKTTIKKRAINNLFFGLVCFALLSLVQSGLHLQRARLTKIGLFTFSVTPALAVLALDSIPINDVML